MELVRAGLSRPGMGGAVPIPETVITQRGNCLASLLLARHRQLPSQRASAAAVAPDYLLDWRTPGRPRDQLGCPLLRTVTVTVLPFTAMPSYAQVV